MHGLPTHPGGLRELRQIQSREEAVKRSSFQNDIQKRGMVTVTIRSEAT